MRLKNEQVVLVDKNGNKLGLMDKLEAHHGNGTLHRAISVVLYRLRNGKKELLLQQRSKGKPLWPLFWTNTVCTHPRDGESYKTCAVRRLKEEMGIVLKEKSLSFVFRILYQATYNKELSEYELDSVFLGKWDGEYHLVLDEAADARWADWHAVTSDVKKNPNRYTPWFQKIMHQKEIIEYFK